MSGPEGHGSRPPGNFLFLGPQKTERVPVAPTWLPWLCLPVLQAQGGCQLRPVLQACLPRGTFPSYGHSGLQSCSGGGGGTLSSLSPTLSPQCCWDTSGPIISVLCSALLPRPLCAMKRTVLIVAANASSIYVPIAVLNTSQAFTYSIPHVHPMG